MPTLVDYRLECRRLLHDASGKFWSDSELNDYINDARTRVCSDTGCLRELVTAYLTTGKEAYFVGQVTGASITDGGSGYTSPTVSFTGGGGTGAAATLTVAAGVITAITFTSYGSGYTSAPTAVISPPAGGVGSLTMVSPGIGYLTLPTIGFTGGGGSGAAATPIMGSNAQAATFNQGTGYVAGDVISITGGTFTSPARYVVWAVGGAGQATAVINIDRGAYSVIPLGAFYATTGGSGTGATITDTFGVYGATITNAGTGYTSAPTVSFTGGSPSAAAIYTANVQLDGATIAVGVVPDDTLDILNITPLWGNQRVPLNYMAFTEFNAKWRTWTVNPQRPVAWSKYGTSGNYSAYMQPVPDQTYTTEFDTAVLPDALVSDVTEDVLRFPYTAPVAYYACWKAKIKQQAFAESESFARDYKVKVVEAQAAQQMRRMPNAYAGYSGG